MKQPMNKDAELNVLGAMLNSKEALYEAMAVLDDEFFSSDETINVFNLIIEASSKGAVKSSILVKMAKSQREKALIQTADNSFIDYESFKVDLEEVQNAYLNRQLYHITEKTKHAIENGKKAKDTIDSISDDLSRLYFDDDGTNIIDPNEDADEGLREFIEGLDNPDSTYGIRFSTEIKGKTIGFPGLDEVFRGAQGGDLFLLAARTGEGKTALAVNLARMFSLYQPYRGYYENTEMKIKELRSRLIAPLADVKVEEIMNSKLEGSVAERDFKQTNINRAFDYYKKSGLHLSRIPVLSSNKAKALAKQVRNKYGNLDYLMVDYIGRMDLEDSKGYAGMASDVQSHAGYEGARYGIGRACIHARTA